MAYNVFLYNGLGISAETSRTVLSGQDLLAMAQTLQGYFNRVVRAHDRLVGPNGRTFGSASVIWLSGFPAIALYELLVYLMPFGTTIANSGKIALGHPPPGHDGLTNPNLGGTGSEVYLHFSDPLLLANLMFHEAMHNKLALSNKGLHGRGGLAAAEVQATTPLTDGNINDMAAALAVNRPQWVTGIGLLETERLRPDSDPSKGLF